MSTDPRYRIEQDSLGEVKVPTDALYGPHTQRAIENFPISGIPMPLPFLRALGLIKASAARANRELGQLEPAIARAIAEAAEEVARGMHSTQFPVDIFQTGSGTSTNMNANEVIATLATKRLGQTIHPNDHVNRGQSSNDVIPTAIHLSARLLLRDALFPSLENLVEKLRNRSADLADVVKTGRTHLQDALPLTFGQELGCWATQIEHDLERLHNTLPRLECIAQGGTAIGGGLNAHPDFAERFAVILGQMTGINFRPSDNLFSAIASQDTAVELSGQLRVTATSLTRIANDLRWMSSGPLSGLNEITLPPLQPGSSIMPGKINPVIPEAVMMVGAQITGNDATIAIAGQSGNFQLNTMLPLIAYNLLQSITLLSNAARLLTEKVIMDFTVNTARIKETVDRNPVLATALNDLIGYDKVVAIVNRAYKEGRPIKAVAKEMTDLSEEEIERLLDPLELTRNK